MRNFKLSYLHVLALLVVASGCKKEEEVPRGEYAVGVVILNEGNFTDADGTVGYYDPTSKDIQQDIYQKVNNETVSGSFQSFYTFEDRTYIIDQKGHKIIVVEAETFKYVATINAGLNTPRYMTIANGKGYVSNWGDWVETGGLWTLPNSYIAVIDLTSFTVINTLNTSDGVEGLTTINNQVYAAAAYSTKVHIINPANDEIVGGYDTPYGPSQFVEDGNGRLWVLCSNNLVKIDITGDRILNTFEIAGGARSITSNGDGSKIYYLSAPWGVPAEIYVIDNSATFAPQKALITGDSFYGLGVNPDDETIYVGISNPTSNGTIVRYNSDGTELDNFASGRFPNGFEFRR